MSLILNNANDGGTDFEPDPFLDTDGEYEARLLGVCEVGRHQTKDFENEGSFKEILQALITYELVEEDTYVTRGAEGAEYKIPRQYTKFAKFSSHEKAALFLQCKSANAESITKDGLDIEKALGHPIMLTLKTNKEGTRQNIDEIKSVPVKFRNSIGSMVGKPFLYTCLTSAGAHVGTIEDVPLWNLKFAVDKSLNPEAFPNLEEIEDLIEAANTISNGAGKELEGDRAPEKEEKKPTKKVNKEDKATKTEDDKPKRARRSKKDDTEVDEYAGLDEAALEDLLIEKGASDEDLDTLSEGADSDEAYLLALKSKLKSMS